MISFIETTLFYIRCFYPINSHCLPTAAPAGLSEGAFSGSYFVPRQSNQNEGAQPLLTMSHSVGSLSKSKSASSRDSLESDVVRVETVTESFAGLDFRVFYFCVDLLDSDYFLRVVRRNEKVEFDRIENGCLYDVSQ